MSEKNNWIIKWLIGALWGVIILAVSETIKSVVANDVSSRDRDDKLSIRTTLAEIVSAKMQETQKNIENQLTEIKTQNIKTSDKLDKILTKVDCR